MEVDPSNHRICIGDARTCLDDLQPDSIGLVVTSPPYGTLKNYDHPAQIGALQSYGSYLAAIQAVLTGCYRVLHPGCRMIVNIGDQYLRASEHGRYRVLPIPADITVVGERLGFDFMGAILWRKISTTRTTGGCCLMGSMYYPKDGHVTYEHEYILMFRKPGKWLRPSKEQRELSRLTKSERTAWFRGVWEIPPERQNGHQAMFPVEVPHRLIKMYSFVGETILDPFLGSGTTTLAAMQLGRDSIGIELNPGFLPLMQRKLDLVRAGTRDTWRSKMIDAEVVIVGHATSGAGR